jgi:anti-anti-sigma factor
MAASSTNLNDHQIDDGVGRVVLHGDIDLATAGDITEAVATARAAGRSWVIIDMTDVTFMDSQGLQALLCARHELADVGGLLTLRGTPEQVLVLLDVCGVRELFSIER